MNEMSEKNTFDVRFFNFKESESLEDYLAKTFTLILNQNLNPK